MSSPLFCLSRSGCSKSSSDILEQLMLWEKGCPMCSRIVSSLPLQPADCKALFPTCDGQNISDMLLCLLWGRGGWQNHAVKNLLAYIGSSQAGACVRISVGRQRAGGGLLKEIVTAVLSSCSVCRNLEFTFLVSFLVDTIGLRTFLRATCLQSKT